MENKLPKYFIAQEGFDYLLLFERNHTDYVLKAYHPITDTKPTDNNMCIDINPSYPDFDLKKLMTESNQEIFNATHMQWEEIYKKLMVCPFEPIATTNSQNNKYPTAFMDLRISSVAFYSIYDYKYTKMLRDIIIKKYEERN